MRIWPWLSTLSCTLLAGNQVSASFQDSGGNGFIFSAEKSVNSSTNAVVCISGAVPQNTYIGFGIPYYPNAPTMIGSEMYLVYATDDGTVKLLHGKGVFIDTPTLWMLDGNSPGSTEGVLVSGNSSYKGGKLKACFERRLDGEGGAVSLAQGKSGFIWSMGPVDSFGQPRFHSPKNRGQLKDVRLFGSMELNQFAGAASKSSARRATNAFSLLAILPLLPMLI
ncbi:hypothetical protein HDU77_000595 [Chytriomyces hyalinus]|nr:hypothetical protein HDU77_000595 [Chytriomyces hyalinus]